MAGPLQRSVELARRQWRLGSCDHADVIGRSRKRRSSAADVVTWVGWIDAVGWRGTSLDLNAKNPPSILRLNDVQGEVEVRNDEVQNRVCDGVLHELGRRVGTDSDDPTVIIHAE